MKLHRFYKENGALDCIVNLDEVVAAKPAEDGRMFLHTQNMSISVDAKQFEKAMEEKDEKIQSLVSVINRLIQAMDRMTVRIPTSIRMHM